MPEDAEKVHVSRDALGWNAETQSIRVDKLLAHCSLADSATDANRKLKSNAVYLNDALQSAPWLRIENVPMPLALRVGKRAKIAIIE
jgi:hypothetical protein